MELNRKAARRTSGPLTLTVLLTIAGSVAAATLFGSSSPSKPATSSSSKPAAVQKPPYPSNPAPKVGPPDPIPLDPAATGPLPMPDRAAQILVGVHVADAELPYDYRQFTTTSFYEFPPTTVYTDLAAGSFTSNPNQGILRVIVLNPAPFGTNSSGNYPAPTATGPVTITAVQDNQVDLVSTAGNTYQFDLTTHAFS